MSRHLDPVGPPGAGKSAIANPLARAKGAAIIDSDDVKKVLPEFNAGLGTTAVHEESSEIASRVLTAISNEGANIVIPRVGGTSASLMPSITKLKQKGYEVFVVLVDVSPQEALKRMLSRFATTGRLVNPTYARNVGDSPARTYIELKRKGDLDGFAKIDNSGSLTDPKAILEDPSGILGGLLF